MADNTTVNSRHTRVSGGTAGTTGNYKKDSYASGPVPKGMVATKVGKDPNNGYSGPNISTVSPA